MCVRALVAASKVLSTSPFRYFSVRIHRSCAYTAARLRQIRASRITRRAATASHFFGGKPSELNRGSTIVLAMNNPYCGIQPRYDPVTCKSVLCRGTASSRRFHVTSAIQPTRQYLLLSWLGYSCLRNAVVGSIVIKQRIYFTYRNVLILCLPDSLITCLLYPHPL